MFKIIGRDKLIINGNHIIIGSATQRCLDVINDKLLYAYCEISLADGDLGEALFWNCDAFFRDGECKTTPCKLYGDSRTSFKDMISYFNQAKQKYDNFK